jgi:phage-related protein
VAASLTGLVGPSVAAGDGFLEMLVGIFELIIESIQTIFEVILDAISSIFG